MRSPDAYAWAATQPKAPLQRPTFATPRTSSPGCIDRPRALCVPLRAASSPTPLPDPLPRLTCGVLPPFCAGVDARNAERQERSPNANPSGLAGRRAKWRGQFPSHCVSRGTEGTPWHPLSSSVPRLLLLGNLIEHLIAPNRYLNHAPDHPLPRSPSVYLPGIQCS